MFIGEFCVVRCRDAGVHMGIVKAISGRTVVLECDIERIKQDGCRRLYRWRGANTLHEVAMKGVDQEFSRISKPTQRIALLDACEVIPCTEDAKANLTKSRWAK